MKTRKQDGSARLRSCIVTLDGTGTHCLSQRAPREHKEIATKRHKEGRKRTTKARRTRRKNRRLKTRQLRFKGVACRECGLRFFVSDAGRNRRPAEGRLSRQALHPKDVARAQTPGSPQWACRVSDAMLWPRASPPAGATGFQFLVSSFLRPSLPASQHPGVQAFVN